jgi:PAS domain S-box-containing protein
MSTEPVRGSDSQAARVSDSIWALGGLRESAVHFAQLVASVRDYAVFLLDPEGNILTWNAGAELIKGYKAEEIIGQHFSRFYTTEAISIDWPAHELRVAATTGRFEDEGWRIRKDRTRFWANVVITALRDEAGRIGGYLKITRDLTDRKQLEEKLRLSEERFRLLVEGVRDYAIFMLDPQGRVATWNTGAMRLKGYAANEIIGLHFSRFYPEEAIERDWPAEELRRASAEGRLEDEGWRVRKDGTRFWANVVITALRDESGNLRGFAKVTRDLTRSKQAEENERRLIEEEASRKAAERFAKEIEQQKEQLRVTLASIGDAVIVTDTNGNVTFLNAVAAGLTGWRPEEAYGRPLESVFRIVNEKTKQLTESPVGRVLREKTIVGLANHTALVARDGRWIPVEDTAAPIITDGGPLAGAVLVFRDVTEARRAMEARMHLAAIVESSDDAIIGESLEGLIVSWNRGAERLYGYSRDEIVGRPLSILVPPEQTDELPSIMRQVAGGQHIQHFETVRVRKDGSRVAVSLTISPIKNADGKVVGVSKIARDITALKKEARWKDEFVSLLAHELRNPLFPLRNSLELIRLGGNDREAVERNRAMMERQVGHLATLVNDLLDVSRMYRDEFRLHKEQVDIEAVVERALEKCQGIAKERECELTVSIPDERLIINADKARLGQVLFNLLTNAVKYSDRGARIGLTVERDDNEVVIRVKDTGAGIAPSMLPQVFDLFAPVDQPPDYPRGGLGVGLAIVKHLVEMHGGTIEAQSAGLGLGSEFEVRLPLAAHIP